MREHMTIDELKTYAIEHNYDGFAIFTEPEDSKEANSVYFKQCTGLQDNQLLSHALTHSQGLAQYLLQNTVMVIMVSWTKTQYDICSKTTRNLSNT